MILSLVLLGSMLASVASAAPACKAQAPNVFTLPGNASSPEGVVVQHGTPYFYTTSAVDGTIYQGSLHSSVMTPFISGAEYNMTGGLGMKIYGDHLFVAGGTNGALFDFSLSSKTLLHRFSGITNGSSLLNDLAVVSGSGDVYVTDSFLPILWKAGGRSVRRDKCEQKLKPWLDLSATVDYQPGKVSGNGIVVMPGKRFVVLADTNDSKLYRVCLLTKEVVEIGLNGTIGSPDGILYDAPHLYAVNGASIDVIELSAPYLNGTVVGKIANDLLLKPSTIDFVQGPGVAKKELLAANFQANAVEPVLPYSLVRVPIEY
ncbi:hypothetical protein BZA05DRAFT_430658 [Tricharina praecox]|uniref:uncharacterized protein n=1 Tax=Tricharina praecox TaxID=43433 RepID=UPI00221FBD61|nr:uncharacterized protein BZA05DRAFT_430658 [Tricharina praecox]KAI5849895.1 hypothetical protein BZA05DRAFT_430658 [Tricharina praecox]